MMQFTQRDANYDTEHVFLRPTVSEVYACQFSSWYFTFRDMQLSVANTDTEHSDTQIKHRKNVTIESIVISPLPSEFINYLLSDGVRLPDCATKVSSCLNDVNCDDDDTWDNQNEDENSGGGDERKRFSFPSLTEEIQSAINILGGEGRKGCMPKLNWSSPKDATWINCGSLKCTKAGDVYLLLKSSEFVVFDLERAWKDVDDGVVQFSDASLIGTCVPEEANLGINSTAELNVADNQIPCDFRFELVLRKWCNLHPSMEFRCFVYNHELIAISQRHPSKYYPHLQQPSHEQPHPMIGIIQKFFCTYVRKRFSGGNVHRYVVDLYVDSQQRTWILDFNVWGTRTDGLLFDWKELVELGLNVSSTPRHKPFEKRSIPPLPQYRVVTEDMKTMSYDPLSSFRGPTDAIDLMGSCSSDNNGNFAHNPSFEDFMKQCVHPSDI
ncbi:hypothetical protein HJC23_005692 [Cyclotella cryptica]|uniref:Cell division cycle protein 123 n=1 Tax=Cyclotella cryptica TaxID=29204 RepID=A0ABD3P435_9STRA|eukprot:CCRYP_017755-RA/>CCRYP_017755-RA protein AED:0.00 eAED:0.00 QI:180/1/1/1/1/1/2/1682/438